MKCVRVALVCTKLSSRGGGIPAAVVPLAEALAALPDLQVDLFGFDAPERHPSGVTLHVLKTRGPQIFKVAFELRRRLENGAYDVIHTHGLWTSISLAATAWAWKKKRLLIISPHGMLDKWALANSPVRKLFARLFFENRHFRRARFVHALNLSESESVRRVFPKSEVIIIPNGINVSYASKRKAGVLSCEGEDRRVLLYLGRIHPKKGLQQLISMWAAISSARAEVIEKWRVVIAGWDDGGHLAALETQVKALGLEREVTFPGALYGADKEAAYRAAGAFVLPSKSEGFPMTILEAWSNGVPTFVTDACNVNDAIEAGAAIRIGSDEVEELDAICDALMDPERLKSTSARALSYVESFDWPIIANRWASFYRGLVEEGERRSPPHG